MTPGLGVSYGVLVVAQGALVLAPLESRERRRVVAVGLLAPVAALGLGVGLLRGFATSPRALAVLAAVATPVLAAASGWFLRGRRPWLSAICAGGLYLLAWQSSSLAGQAAGMILIGL